MTSHGQCPRGGGACECPRVGAFFKLMTSRGQCPRGGGAPGVPPIQVQTPPTWLAGYGPDQGKLEIAQSEQDVSPFCKESDMTYS